MTDQVNEAKIARAIAHMEMAIDAQVGSRVTLHRTRAREVLAALQAAQRLATRPARGVVDEAMVERGIEAAVRWALVDSGYSPDQLGDWRNKITPSELAAFRANTVAILQAAALPAVPDGWVLVPKVPTTEMIGAACDTTGLPLLREATRIKREWKAMLAATPAHDQPEGEG